jgi:dihydrofolate reductase
MIISLIAAIGKNYELGRDNKLLWNLPADMKHFRDTTRGHTVIMGRKTFESIGRPLPNRENIVITRDPVYQATGVTVVHSLEEALRYAALEQGKHFEEKQEDTEIFIIGGAEIYKQGIALANKLYITHVDATLAADTFFPAIGSEWKKVSEEKHPADAENQYPFTFTQYKK